MIKYTTNHILLALCYTNRYLYYFVHIISTNAVKIKIRNISLKHRIELLYWSQTGKLLKRAIQFTTSQSIFQNDQVESTPLKQFQQKLNIITFMKGKIYAGLLYVDCISLCSGDKINLQLGVSLLFLVMLISTIIWSAVGFKGLIIKI